MTDLPRLFADDDAIRRVGEGFLSHTLPRAGWTHEAHLATCLWLLVERRDIDVDAEIGDLIRGYNVSAGGVNDATQGYHQTITQAYVAGVRFYLGTCGAVGLASRVNAMLASEIGRRDWPLRFWSRDRLFSPEARLRWVEPDLAPLPGA